MSNIFDLGLSFYFMSKNGKHFLKFVSIIFEVASNINYGLYKKSETQFPPSAYQL